MRLQELNIRTAGRRDAGSVAQIYVDSWNAGFGSLMPERQLDKRLVARWQNDLIAPFPHRWWVAVSGGSILGFAGICASRDPIDPVLGELDTIAVDPASWCHGVGRALMATALTHLVRDGYREAVLWTLASYPRGQIFYEKTGWQLDGRVRDGGRQVLYRHGL